MANRCPMPKPEHLGPPWPPASIDAKLRDLLKRSRKPFHIPNGPHVQTLFKELGELRYRLKAEKSELETKQDLMLRLDRSPHFADAICMTFRAEATYGI